MKLEDLIREKRKRIWIKCYLRREPRNRPTDPDKERALILLDYLRFRKLIREGKLEMLGDRRYRLRI